MPELRKRPAPKETATPAPSAKRSASKPRAGTATTTKTAAAAGGKVKKVATRAKDAAVAAEASKAPAEEEGIKAGEGGSVAGETPETKSAAKEEKEEEEEKVEAGAVSGPLGSESVGSKITLDGFGGTVKTHSGDDVTMAELVGKSEKGVVLFTYPKASTPGCTTQACLFRDSYAPLQAAGLSVYGLSNDSPKANTTFATKQKLPFDLLCDPDAGLTGALGLKKSQGKGTLRGSVVISKEGVVEVWNQAGPAKTLEAVTQWIDGKK